VVGGPTRNPSKTNLVSPVQAVAQRANLLGLSEDRYLNDYVDAEELRVMAQISLWPADDARRHARAGGAKPDRGLPQRRVSPLGADLMDLRCLGSILLLQAIQQLPQVSVEFAASARSKLAERSLQIPMRHSNVGTLAHHGRFGRKFRVHANLPMAPL